MLPFNKYIKLLIGPSVLVLAILTILLAYHWEMDSYVTEIEFEEKTNDEITAYLSKKNHQLRHKATDEILRRGLSEAEIFEIVLANLNNSRSSIFCTGCNILRKYKKANENIIIKLMEATNSEDLQIRSCSANALGVVGKDNVLIFNQLMLLLEDPHGIVRESAMEAIVGYGELAKAAIPLFIANMNYSMPDYDVNGVYIGSAYFGVKAVELISEIDSFDKDAINALLLQVEKPSFFSNNKTASESLAKMAKTNPEIIDIVNKKFNSNGEYSRVLIEIGTDEAIKLIIQAVESPAENIRLNTINTIGDVAKTLKDNHKKLFISKLEELLQKNEYAENWNGTTGNIVHALIEMDIKNTVLREFLISSLNKKNFRDNAKYALERIKYLESRE